MTRSDIVAALRKSIPANVDYGQIDYSRLARFDGVCALKQADAIADKNRLTVDILGNVQLGLERW